MNLVEKLRGIRDLTILECGHDVNDWAEYDHECIGRAEEAADRIEALEDSIVIIEQAWMDEDWKKLSSTIRAALNQEKDQ